MCWCVDFLLGLFATWRAIGEGFFAGVLVASPLLIMVGDEGPYKSVHLFQHVGLYQAGNMCLLHVYMHKNVRSPRFFTFQKLYIIL